MSRVILFAFALMFGAMTSLAQAATPPDQPEQGPGGKDYQVSEVVKRAVGSAEEPVFVFHGKNTPSHGRPVIIFFHSWGGNNPQYFGGWIEHLARKGNLVLFPRFQEVNRTRPIEATANASRMVREALKALADDPEAKPDLNRVVYVGYLAGTIVALDLAAGAEDYHLPAPKLIMNLMPGGVAKEGETRGIAMPDLAKIKAETLLITMNGDQEHAPADRISRQIFAGTTAIPATSKLFMRVASDRHGYPPLSATLVSPGSNRADYAADQIPLPPSAIVEEEPQQPVKGKGKARQAQKKAPRVKWTADMALTGPQSSLTQLLGSNGTDNVDYRGFWKTLDIASDAAFNGKDAVALKANPALVDMGMWSDGWPVRRLGAEMPKEGTEAAAEPGPRRRF